MTIEKSKMISILKKCLSGVETKDNLLLEGADTFLFDGEYVHTYNDNISVSVKLTQSMNGLKGAIKADELYKIISKLSEEKIMLSIKEKQWVIKCGKAKIELSMKEDSVSSFILDLNNQEGEWKELPEDFIPSLNCVRIPCNGIAFSGIFMKENKVISTDGRKMNLFTLDKEMDCFWISDLSSIEISKIQGLKKYRVSPNWVSFESSEEVYFSCRKLNEDNYPYEKILSLIKEYKQEKGDLSGELPMSIKDAVDRAFSLSMNVNGNESVEILFSKENIMIHSERSTGKFTEKVDWGEEKGPKEEFEPFSIYLDLSILSYGLSRSPKFFIKKTASGKIRIIFHGDKFIHIASLFSKEK